MFVRERKYFRIKIIILVFYIVFCLVGFPLIFIFPPRNFLFNDDSVDDADKMFLFKNFVTETYDNINKNFIQNMTYTKENEECPEDFETLVIKHQYYGNFTHLFGNSSFCIKRYNNSEWSLKRILERNEKSCTSNQKPCGIANLYSKTLLCVNKEESCPLNNFSYPTNDRNVPSYQLAHSNCYFYPQYNENNEGILIIDIDLVYKYRICLEKFHRFEKLKCEFADDDECFIEDDVTIVKKPYPEISSDPNIRLTPINLAKYNIKNNDQLEHDYCEGAKKEDKKFLTFSKGFVNFDKEELDNFLEEFPEDNSNNPLYDIVETYKKEDNFESLYYYFACIIFSWSVLHLIIQILMFFIKDEDILILIRRIFVWNGIILFIIKLICVYVLIASHYSFYLKFKNVYLKLEEDPRNEILSDYKNLRRIFIIKLFVIWIAGFIIICIELIIFGFILTVTRLYLEEIEEIKLSKPNQQNHPDQSRNIEVNIDLSTKKNNDSKINEKEEGKPIRVVIPPSSSPLDPSAISNPYKRDINLIFQFKHSIDNIIKTYEIKADSKEIFNDIEQRLKQQYPELENEKMGIFRKDSEIINKEKNVMENNVENNALIIIDN